MPFLVENLIDVLQRHGGSAIEDKDARGGNIQQTFLLPDGATVTVNRMGGFQEQPPPGDPVEAAKAKKYYHELHLSTLRAAFKDVKKVLLGEYIGVWAHDGPSAGFPPWQAIFPGDKTLPSEEALEVLSEKARPHKQAIAEIDAFLKPYFDRQEAAKAVRQAEEDRRWSEVNERRNRIMGIQFDEDDEVEQENPDDE